MNSAMKGYIDVLYTWYSRASTPTAHRWFRQGYGNMEMYDRMVGELHTAWKTDGLESMLAAGLELEWTAQEYSPSSEVLIVNPHCVKFSHV